MQCAHWYGLGRWESQEMNLRSRSFPTTSNGNVIVSPLSDPWSRLYLAPVCRFHVVSQTGGREFRALGSAFNIDLGCHFPAEGHLPPHVDNKHSWNLLFTHSADIGRSEGQVHQSL